VTARVHGRVNGCSGFSAIIVLLLFLVAACGGGAEGKVVITGKTVYAGMAIEEVQVRVFRLDGGQWKEAGSGRSGSHGSFIVKAKQGMIRLEARGEIFRNNKKIPLAGRVTALEVPSGTRRMDRVVIDLAPEGMRSPGGEEGALSHPLQIHLERPGHHLEEPPGSSGAREAPSGEYRLGHGGVIGPKFSRANQSGSW